jgi:hypothetical protein
MQWLRIAKYTVFLILLKFQNLWNLINVLILKIMNNLIVSYDFLKVQWVQENQIQELKTQGL